MNAVLDIRGLTVTFPGLVQSTKVLRGVDLTVNAGDVMGLVGESGSGKSMTALACLGMVPARGVVHGSIVLDGNEVIGCPENDMDALRGGAAAMIFQNPSRSLNPFFTIERQMVGIIRRHRRVRRDEARTEAIRVLTAVQVPDPEIVLGKYPHQLSGGQVQRVMIATALACRPKLLIADEPTTALDVTVQAQIMSLLIDAAKRDGLTILFITHDLGVVSTMCNRIAVMYAGQIVESGNVEQVIDRPRHPYTLKLVSTVTVVGAIDKELKSIPGCVPNLADLPDGCTFHDRCDRATTVCEKDAPKMRVVDNEHAVACHHALEAVPNGSEGPQ